MIKKKNRGGGLVKFQILKFPQEILRGMSVSSNLFQGDGRMTMMMIMMMATMTKRQPQRKPQRGQQRQTIETNTKTTTKTTTKTISYIFDFFFYIQIEFLWYLCFYPHYVRGKRVSRVQDFFIWRSCNLKFTLIQKTVFLFIGLPIQHRGLK